MNEISFLEKKNIEKKQNLILIETEKNESYYIIPSLLFNLFIIYLFTNNLSINFVIFRIHFRVFK